MNRRFFVATMIAAVALPGAAVAQQRPGPSSGEIMRRLEAAPSRQVRQQDRVSVQEFKRRPELRRAAPSIDIQAINFAFASADIPRSEYGKVREIADALQGLLRRRRGARFLIEGHTDAVGSWESNQILSERRAESLRRVLAREFSIPARTLETVGYGKEYLLVNTPHEDWRNRRVTIRRIDDFLR